MRRLSNSSIRDACREHDVNLWQVAERLGIADTTFSKELRRELSARRKREILEVVAALGKETEDYGYGDDLDVTNETEGSL